MRPFDVLFFDAAFTLILPRTSVGEQYASVARRFGIEADGSALDAGFKAAWRAARASSAGMPYGRTEEDARRFWRGIVGDTFERSGTRLPPDPYFDTLFAHFESGECWFAPDDVRPAIAAARQAGLRVGVLSNFDARLFSILESLGLANLFDFTVVSCEVGVEKPDPRIFDYAGKIAGSPPDRIAMIGDTPGDDYRGPVAAGWRARLVDRDGAGDSDGAPVSSDLVGAVERLLRP